METHSKDQVCLLIDFENMVRGLASLVGEEKLADALDVGVLFGLAEEYGRVVLARAYADWRMRDMSPFQFDLYNQGVELVHVLAKGKKNAVDVKLAVDAIEVIWELPNIQTFVLVSGDRDFIHVLKALRRHGKTVIGVAPDNAVSEDFAALCDRFVAYSALKNVQSEQMPEITEMTSLPPLQSVKDTLRKLLLRSPEGIKGSQIIPALRREISPKFDVSSYGYAKLSAMLHALHDVVEVRSSDTGDILVLLNRKSPQRALVKDAVTELVDAAGLKKYRYVVSSKQRRQVLFELHHAMSAQTVFTLNDVAQRVLEETLDSKLTLSVISKYHTMLWHAQTFLMLPDQQNLPFKERQMRLGKGHSSFAAFVAHYEHNVVFKARQAQPSLDAKAVLELLGLDSNDLDALSYAKTLLLENGTFDATELIVPGVGGAPDFVFVQRITALFDNQNETHSRGRLLNQLRKVYQGIGVPFDYATVNTLFDSCVKHGLILETRDGATRVYHLGAERRLG